MKEKYNDLWALVNKRQKKTRFSENSQALASSEFLS